MLGHKGIATISGWKAARIVEGHLQGCRMRLEQGIGHDGLSFEIRALALEARILVVAHVVPGPSIEAALTHTRHVVGHQIVAKLVPFIGRAPEVTRCGVNGKPHAVSDARCKYFAILALGG